jgi:transposase
MIWKALMRCYRGALDFAIGLGWDHQGLACRQQGLDHAFVGIDKEMYKARHLIENFFCKLKQFRAIATRYDKTARNFLAGIQLAAAVILLN